MAKKVPDVKLEPATKGMQSNYSHYSASPNSWSFLENFDTDRQGVLKTRPNIYLRGTSTTDFQGAGAMQSIDSSGLPYERFLVKSGTACYNIQANDAAYAAFSANSITFANAGDIARFDTIQGLAVFACNGNNVRYSSDGSTAANFATTGLGMPTTTDIISCGFSGRIWGATGNTAPGASFIQDRVYYSDVIPASGVQNTTGSGQYIRVNTKGKFITGLVEANNVLYVFTADSVFRIYNTQSVDNTPFINIGAVRQEAIVKTFDSIYFFHFTGVYKLDGNGATKISQDIDDFIGRMAILTEAFGANPPTTYLGSYLKRVFGWFDEQSVYFSVDWDPGFAGAATDKDRTYIVRFNYLFKTWSVYSLKDFRLSWAVSNFFPSDYGGLTIAASMAPITLILGRNITEDVYVGGYYDIPPYYDGEKNALGTGEFFLGEPLGDWSFFGDATYTPSTTSNIIRPIYSNGETQWLDFGLENHVKEINGISIASENGQGFQLMYQIDNEQEQKSDRRNPVWYEIGTLGKDYVSLFLDFKSKPFYRIKFKISGQTLGRPVEIGNMVFLSVTDEGYGKN